MEPNPTRFWLAPILTLVLATAAGAASPVLSIITPRGAQRGTEVVLTFRGDRLADAREVLFYSPGFSVLDFKVENPKVVRVRVALAADCALGEHAMRLRTASGVSELRTFYVGALPVVDEKEDNGDFASPQAVALDATISGRVTAEDVDYLAFEGKAGQRVTAEIEAMRLGGAVFDPYVAILDAGRFELAASDDTALARQDAIASVVLPADGRYVVEVRESAYGGGNDFFYRLHLGTFPRPLSAVPSGGRPGETLEVRFQGDAAGDIVRTITVPEVGPGTIGLWIEDEHGVCPSPVPFTVRDLPGQIEAEPNQGRPRANRIAVPGAVHGLLGTPRDEDFFKFSATKGQTLDLRVLARDLRSPVDPVIHIWRTGGKYLAGNDDANRRPDSALRFQVPEDGEYDLRIRDFLLRGGPSHAYRIEIAPVERGLTLSTPEFRRYTQDRQAIPVPRGNRFATFLSIERRDFGGPVAASFADLPPGVTAVSEAAPANLGLVPVVFEAADDAPVAAALARIEGAHADPATGIAGGYRHRVDLSFGEPNRSVYWTYEADRLPVAVTEPAPFRIEVVQPAAPIVQSGAMNLRIVAERRDGFDQPIRCWMLYNPPGIGSKGGVVIEKGKTEVLMPINANGNAAVGTWRIAIIATADHRGPLWVSSQLASLEVATRYVDLTLQRAAATQGTTGEMYCQLTVRKPFEGQATARLLRLPAKVASPVQSFAADATELRFPVAIDPASPPGNHKNVFCQVVVTVAGEPVVHNIGSAELRVDRPRPAPVAAAAPARPAPPPPKPDAPTPPRPPSRLEQLRAEFDRQRAEPGDDR